jgi:predicted phage terminase large subunit-like protein
VRRTPILLSDEEYEYLTDDEKIRYQKDLKIEQGLGSPLDYMLAVNKKAKSYPHVKIISDVIVALVEHRLYPDGPGPNSIQDAEGIYRHPITGVAAIDRLKVAMPPRHSKSFTISQHTPGWFLSNYPDLNVILATMGEDFASKWGSANRDNITNNPEFGIELRPDMTSKVNWKIKDHDGGMKSVGIGGQITGEGAHLFIIDDYLKNMKEAKSETIRNDQWEWYNSTIETRLEPGGVVVILATRWHEDDLQGRLEESEGHLWYSISMPALAYETTDEDGISIDPETGVRDALGRKPFEPLCPDRFKRPHFERIKAKDAAMFSALYQCQPSIAAGNKFQNFPRYRLRVDPQQGEVYTVLNPDGAVQTYAASKCFKFATIDLAMTAKTSSDWCVFTVFDVTHDRKLLIRNVDRKRVKSEDHMDWFGLNYSKYRPRYAGVEEEIRGTMLMGNVIKQGKYIVIGLTPDADKEARAITATTCFRDNLVFIPEEAEWVDEFVKELKKFPNAKHDDQVDTVSYGAEIFWNMSPWSIAPYSSDDSIEARMERYVAARESDFHEHPELGIWN